MTILGALITRSVRRRRLRNAALASGTYEYEPNGAESKPVLWETLITSASDGEKGWPGLLVRPFSNLFLYYHNLHAESKGVCHG